jgi:two-component system, chemotaxis family, sensor kinase Cph1
MVSRGRLAPDRRDAGDVLRMLRSGTASEHAALERSLDLLDPELDRARLTGVLARMHGFWRSAESGLDIVLECGSTVLLYTDGLVERRDQVFDDGIELLGRALSEEHDRPVEQICDALLRRLIPDGAEDDVALVGVRLLPPSDGR